MAVNTWILLSNFRIATFATIPLRTHQSTFLTSLYSEALKKRFAEKSFATLKQERLLLIVLPNKYNAQHRRFHLRRAERASLLLE